MSVEILSLDAKIDPDISTPGSDRAIQGSPVQKVWNHFSDSTSQFHAGKWSSEPGKWRVRYTENELCVLTAGRLRIVSDSGAQHEFGTGAVFVVPSGFIGTWEVLESCTKIYAIYEPRT